MSGSGSDEPLPAAIELRRRHATACVIGARHIREGRTCQDATRVLTQGDLIAVAVADGHGTSAHGEIGAELAVEIAVHALIRFAVDLGPRSSDVAGSYAEHPLRVQLVREWADRIRERAGAENADLRPYGTTLIFALAAPTFLLIGRIGDGDILLIDGSGRVTHPIAPDPSSFAEETASLCQVEAWSSMRVLAIPPPEHETLLLLSTDGYSKSYATDEIFERIGPDYLDMVRESGLAAVETQLHAILSAVTSGGSGDDIALNMLYWPEASTRTDDTGQLEGSSETAGDPCASS
jgi:hypothetical protein